ncbi:hypothetical protein [Mediterraneibacter gnavus]|uniref:Uncharacterized protein n=1 Tax=Mediterraneibacter gnavus TaxID=33038 RepID=A0A2N5PMG8_MEDGN|nr:hypothetical protein [Mediterraneibacter gnavus]PLT76343.1 hypothetical protein CDL23_04820 [Mediterraneibacter gnavus]
MADIKQYTDQIAQAVYGEEVRSSIINALNKVNDDNNSYQDIKNEIVQAKDDVDEQVANFDAKVASAQSVTTALENATATANTAKSQLTSATSTANTAKTNLTNATSTANTAKSNLETATSNANTAKTNAETAKTNLDASIATANTAKSNLETAIGNANTAKSNLDTSTKTGQTAKTNLETAISNATTAKSQLETVISNADSIKSDLSSVIVSANTAKSNLDSSVATANGVYQSLQNENASASSNLEELRSENFNSQEILAGVADLRAYLGLTDDDILGLQVDYKNKTFTRIAGAVNLTAGADFDKFKMYGGRKRCNVSDDGTITAYYGDDNYAEDGSNGQVMVYQPKFYYLVCPVVYDPIDTGIGYHLRKANYYVSEKARAGFRLHPAFYDANGNELDYILIGAYEGSIYDTSESAYLLLDEQVMTVGEDKFCSIAGVKPASGLTQNLTRPNIETMAQNRGSNWHLENSKIASMEQLLCMIEMGTMNFQTAIGQGVVSISDNSSYNCASLTGSTASLGNGTGRATETINEKGGVQTTETADGKTSVSYRGVENDWGNIWKFIIDPNIWGNGAMGGGEPFYCDDFNFAENKKTDNYKGAGFTVTNAGGYISAMGYSTACDWLFMASECLGNSSLPVGDYHWVTQNLNGYRIARLGGAWDNGGSAGGFCWSLSNGVGLRNRTLGGRLVYVPTATA